MGWTTLLTAAAAGTFVGVQAATTFNLTLDGFSPMIKYTGTTPWTAWFDELPSNAGSSALAKGQGYHTSAIDGGNVKMTFVGSAVSVYGHYGFINGTAAATLPSRAAAFDGLVQLFIDGSDNYMDQAGGNATDDAIRISTQAAPGAALHEMSMDVLKGPITVTSVEVVLSIPVSQSDWESTKPITQLFTTDDGSEVSPDVVTTGDWTAEAQSGIDAKIQNPHMKTEAAGASISYVMGTGNAFMVVSGNAAADCGAFTIEIDPAPYLRNSTVDLLATAPVTIPNTTYYAVALEPEKNYTLTLTNKGDDTASPAFEVNSVTMWKLASALKGDETNSTSGTTGASGSDSDSGGKKSGVSAGAVAGGVIGGFAAAAGLAAALFFFMKRRKAKQRQEEWEKSRDPGGKLDVDGGDNITPFMAAAPPGSTYPDTLSPNNCGPNTHSMISSDPSTGWEMASMSNTNSYYGGPQNAHAPYLQPLLAGQQTTAVGALPPKRGMPIDQPAPQLPQDTDAGPIMGNHDMIPPSYDPSWSAAGSRISTATSTDFNVSPGGYNPALPDVDEDPPNAAGSSSQGQGQGQAAPASSWPKDRKDPRDFQQ